MLESLQGLECRSIMVLVAARKSVRAGFGLAKSLQLPVLDAKSAETLLVALAGTSTNWRSDEASSLVRICGHNPLALKILAGLIKGRHCMPQVCCLYKHQSPQQP